MMETELRSDKTEWLDYWYYKVGVNVIPSDSKSKKPIVKWLKYCNQPLDKATYYRWKEDGKYKNGFSLILGKIWQGENSGSYLIGIDIDKEEGIKTLCNIIKYKKISTIQDLGNITIVEQHKDDLTKVHIYFISPIPFPKKGADSKLGIEIKGEGRHGLMIPTPNIHKNGYRYEFIGNKEEPMLLSLKQATDLINVIDNLCTKYGIKYIQKREKRRLTLQIKNMINALNIDRSISIEKGNRHNLLISIANLILRRHYLSSNKTVFELKKFFLEINNELCKPHPLPEKELERIWVDSLSYVSKERVENQTKRNLDKNENRNGLIEEASEKILINYSILTLRTCGEIRYFKDGVYSNHGHTLIEEELEKEYRYRLSNSILTEIKGHIKRITYVNPEEFDRDLNIINLKNGLYYIKENKSEPHNPEYYSINQKPILYNSKSRPKLFGKFLSQVLYPKDIRTAVEIMAYTFLRYNPHELLFILMGFGSNGKGVFTGILTALHGAKNVSNVSLKSLSEERFALADCENKDTNIDTEVSSGIIDDISTLKKVTGRQPIRIERKNKDAYDVVLHTKFFFSANKVPLIQDDSDARFRREIILPFPFQFEDGQNADPNLLEKLTTEEELSGIFNILMIALRRILKTGRIYLNQKTIQERRARHELIEDPVSSFLKVSIAVDSISSDYIIKDDLHIAYVEYCKFYNLPFESKEKFGKILKNPPHNFADGREPKKDKNGKRRTIWLGVKLSNWVNADRQHDILMLKNHST